MDSKTISLIVASSSSQLPASEVRRMAFIAMLELAFSCGVVLVLLLIIIRLIVLESIVVLGSIHPVTVPTA
jgi:hypothetical protein